MKSVKSEVFRKDLKNTIIFEIININIDSSTQLNNCEYRTFKAKLFFLHLGTRI